MFVQLGDSRVGESGGKELPYETEEKSGHVIVLSPLYSRKAGKCRDGEGFNRVP